MESMGGGLSALSQALAQKVLTDLPSYSITANQSTNTCSPRR